MQYKGVLVRVLNYFHRDQKSLARIGERWKIPSHRILRVEGSAEHSRCTCVDRLSRSHYNYFEHAEILRIEPTNTAIQRCTGRSTEFASR